MSKRNKAEEFIFTADQQDEIDQHPHVLFDYLIFEPKAVLFKKNTKLKRFQGMRYSQASSDDLVSFMMSTMAQHDNLQYRPNALFFCNTAMSALIQLRDQNMLVLSHETVFSAIRYFSIRDLAENQTLETETREALQRYMKIEPGPLDGLVKQQLHQHTIRPIVDLLQSLNNSGWEALGRRVQHLKHTPDKIKTLVRHLQADNKQDDFVLYQNLIDVGLPRDLIIDQFGVSVKRMALMEDLSL